MRLNDRLHESGLPSVARGIRSANLKRSIDFGRHDIDPSALAIEHDLPVDQGEERKVLALTDIQAGMELIAELPHQDMAGPHGLPAEFLDTSPLCVGVPPVPAGTLTFFMGHCCCLSPWIRKLRKHRVQVREPATLAINPGVIKASLKAVLGQQLLLRGGVGVKGHAVAELAFVLENRIARAPEGELKCFDESAASAGGGGPPSGN